MARALTGGTVLCLWGDLGAGKTTFVKGLAEGLGITETITSPTFALMNVYPIQSPTSYSLLPTPLHTLIHIDTYRLKNTEELLGIGVADYLGQSDVITIIEWPEKIKPLLAGLKIKNIYFEHRADGGRSIRVED